MDLATLAIWASLILIGIGVVAILLFGVKSIANGKFRLMSVVAMAVPLAVFGISYALSAGAEHPLAQAAILTGLILMAGAAVLVLVTGLRSLVGF